MYRECLNFVRSSSLRSRRRTASPLPLVKSKIFSLMGGLQLTCLQK
jgi:hypothetical protein